MCSTEEQGQTQGHCFRGQGLTGELRAEVLARLEFAR